MEGWDDALIPFVFFSYINFLALSTFIYFLKFIFDFTYQPQFLPLPLLCYVT